MRWICVLLIACAGAPAPVAIEAPAPPPREPPEDPVATLRAEAQRYADEGVLDVAAELLARAAVIDPSLEDEARQALLDAHAFERAGSEAPGPVADPGALIEALSGDPAHVVEVLGPVMPADDPLYYDLLGRAQLALGDERQARMTFARGRSRADAHGQGMGLWATTAGAIEHIEPQGGRLLIARYREIQLVGGYQSHDTNSAWLELWDPRASEPSLRVAIGIVVGIASMRDAIVVVDRPIDELIGPVPTTLRLFEPRTLAEFRSWPAAEAHALGVAGDRVLTAWGNHVRAYSLDGTITRELTLSGHTPGIMRVYRAGRGTMHDNVPVQYDTQAIELGGRDDGTILAAASDGTLRVFPPLGAEQILEALRVDGPDAMNEIGPLALRVDGASAWTAHRGGQLVRWDLAHRRARVVSDGACTDAESRAMSIGGEPDPRYCRGTRGAAIDGSHVLLVGGMTGSRVRTIDGAPVSTLDTLVSQSRALDGQHAWLGGVSGELERWDMQSGQRVDAVAQGSVLRFMEAISSDGRFIAVRLLGDTPRLRVYDTISHRRVEGIPEAAGQAAIANGILAFANDGAMERWDLARGRRIDALPIADLTQYRPSMSQDGARLAVIAGQRVVVVENGRVLREYAIGADPWSVALSAEGQHVLVGTETDARVFHVSDARELQRFDHAQALAISPAGSRVAFRDGERVRVETIQGRELGSLRASDLAPDAIDMLRGALFATNDTLVISGPGAPGYQIVYRWQLGERPVATQLQVLGAERMERNADGSIAFVYDGNEIVHVLRVHDGALLASAYSTNDGGWIAQSAMGAVDGLPASRAALMTRIDHSARAYGASFAWDRFAADRLLARAAAGELVIPVMPAYLRTVQSWHDR